MDVATKNKIIFVVVSCVVIILATMLFVSINSLPPDMASLPSSSPQSNFILKPSEEEKVRVKSEAKTIDYKEVAKEVQKFLKQPVKYTGKVFQIQETGGTGFMLLSVTDKGYGVWDDNIWVTYSEPTQLLKDDIAMVYGRVAGDMTYQSQAGWNITVPKIQAVVIEKTGQKSPTAKKQNAGGNVAPKTSPASPMPDQGTSPQPEPPQSPQASPSPMRIEGLAAIRIGGYWQNWDADAENDGIEVDIMYLDNRGNLISPLATGVNNGEVPISADVNLYVKSKITAEKKLVFSSRYADQQIIPSFVSPKLRIPKEKINVNRETDNQYGEAEITIYTPQQGTFSAKSQGYGIKLYE